MRRQVIQLGGGAFFLALAALGLGACGGSLRTDEGTSSTSSIPAPDKPADAGAQEDSTSARKVVVNTSLELRVTRVPQAYLEMTRVARSAGGFVADSTVTGDEKSGSATVRLRVPSARHDDVVGQLRALASAVVRESTNAREVTDEYTDLQARVRNLQRNEAQYQALLAQAKTLDEILNINSRLESVRGQIEQTQGRIALLDDLNDFATINVAMSTPPVAVDSKGPTPAEVLGGAWRASKSLALGLANVAVVLVAVGLWSLPFGLLGVGSWRLGRRLSPAFRRLLS